MNRRIVKFGTRMSIGEPQGVEMSEKDSYYCRCLLLAYPSPRSSTGEASLRNSEDRLPHKIGRYIITKIVGSGAMGTVYKAYDPKLARTVALKTIRCNYPTQTTEYKDFLKRFKREAEALGKLSHPSIVALYDMGETYANVPFLAMEYVEGKTLAELRNSGHSFKAAEVFNLVTQMADALDYAHENGVLHCDIKPSNLITLERENKLKITDFGLARILDPARTQHSTIQLVGTPGYMSPEQVMGEVMDRRSDVFSIGVVAFEMLCGKKPFPGKSPSAILVRQIQADPIVPSGLKELGIDLVEWQRIFSKVLAKDPHERYQTASEFASDLKDRNVGLEHGSSLDNGVTQEDATRRPQRNESFISETLTIWTRRLIRVPQRKPKASALGGIAASILLGLVALISLSSFEKPPQSSATNLSARFYPPLTLRGAQAEVNGTISVESKPSGARVTIDGKVLGVTPIESSSLAMGDHAILVEKASWQPVNLSVTINSHSPRVALSISLEEEREAQPTSPAAADHHQRSNPAQSANELNETPISLKADVAAKVSQILIRNDDVFDWVDVTLRVNQGLVLNIDRINAGRAYTIVNPSALEWEAVEIWCETPYGRAYFKGGVDRYGPRATALSN